MAVVQLVSSTSTTATTTVNFTAQPAGTILVLVVGADDYKTADPSGWTLPTGASQQTTLGHYVWYKKATGSETSVAYTIGSASKSVYWMGYISDSIDQVTPVDVSNGQFAASPGFTYSTPTVTTSAGQRVAVASIGGAQNPLSTTGLSAWTNAYTEVGDNRNVGTGTGDIIGVAYLGPFAGGGSTSTTANYDTSNPDSGTGIIVVFKVAAGGGGAGEVARPLPFPPFRAPFIAPMAQPLQLMGDRALAGAPVVYQAAGQADAVSAATGSVTEILVLSGSAAAVSAVTGAVTELLQVSGSADAVSTATGAVTEIALLSGQADAVSTASGDATIVGFIGTVASPLWAPMFLQPSSASQQLLGSTSVGPQVLSVSGTAAATSVASGAVTEILVASGQANATSAATGTVTEIEQVSGQANAVSTASGSASLVGGAQTYPAAGTAAAVSTASGTVTLIAAASSTSAATSAATGTVTLRAVAAGTVAALSAAQGLLTLRTVVSGTAAAVSTSYGAAGYANTPFRDLTVTVIRDRSRVVTVIEHQRDVTVRSHQ